MGMEWPPGRLPAGGPLLPRHALRLRGSSWWLPRPCCCRACGGGVGDDLPCPVSVVRASASRAPRSASSGAGTSVSSHMRPAGLSRCRGVDPRRVGARRRAPPCRGRTTTRRMCERITLRRRGCLSAGRSRAHAGPSAPVAAASPRTTARMHGPAGQRQEQQRSDDPGVHTITAGPSTARAIPATVPSVAVTWRRTAPSR